jgi:hypothetical protein
VCATGAGKLQEVRPSLWPMSLPVYASIVSFGFRLLYNCNIRYDWLVGPFSPGTSTLEEAPSFACAPMDEFSGKADGEDSFANPNVCSKTRRRLSGRQPRPVHPVLGGT